MAELLVVGFRGTIQKSSEVLDELRVLDDEWLHELADAIAIHRKLDRTVTMDQSYQPTGRRAAEWGSILGLLIGATLEVSLIADACPIVAHGVQIAATLVQSANRGGDRSDYWADQLGIDAGFLNQVKSLTGPGSAAIFAILDRAVAASARERFIALGGTVLHLGLDGKLIGRMKTLLKDDEA